MGDPGTTDNKMSAPVSWEERLNVWAYWDNFYRHKKNPDGTNKKDAKGNDEYELASQDQVRAYFYDLDGNIRKDRAAAFTKTIRDDDKTKDDHYTAKRWAFRLGVLVVLLISFASAATVADSVGSHLGVGGAGGYFLELLTMAFVFGANTYIFWRPVANMMKRIFSFDVPFAGLTKKNDIQIVLENDEVIKVTKPYTDENNKNDLEGRERWVYGIGLFAAAVFSFATMALTIEKSPEVLGRIFQMSGPAPVELAWLLGISSFFAYFALLSIPMIKIIKDGYPSEGIIKHAWNNIKKLTCWDSPKYSLPTKLLAITLALGYIALSVWGLTMTNLNQTSSLSTSFMGLSGEWAIVGTAIGMIFGTLGKLPFVIMAAHNTLTLAGRFVRGEKILKDNSPGNRGLSAVLVLVVVNALANGFLSADGVSILGAFGAKDSGPSEEPDGELDSDAALDSDNATHDHELEVGEDDKNSIIKDPKGGQDSTSGHVGRMTLFSGAFVSANSAFAANLHAEEEAEEQEDARTQGHASVPLGQR